VGGQVGVSLLVSRVLGDEVKVFAADDQGSVHFRGDDGAGEDTASDGDQAGEGTFLVWLHSHVSHQVFSSLLRP
jgi:hypothetical protein